MLVTWPRTAASTCGLTRTRCSRSRTRARPSSPAGSRAGGARSPGRHQHAAPVDPVLLEPDQGLVGLIEREGGDRWSNRDLGRLAEEILSVGPGVGLHAGQGLLVEETG